jgi:hypothetical protein
VPALNYLKFKKNLLIIISCHFSEESWQEKVSKRKLSNSPQSKGKFWVFDFISTFLICVLIIFSCFY